MHKMTLLVGYASIFLVLATLVGLFVFVVPVTANPGIIGVPTQYSTIQAAINAASPGDTIMVAPGTYAEHVVVNKSLTLVGENKSTIIDGGGTGTVVTVRANSVNLTGFTIQNGGTNVADCGLVVWNYTGCTISNNTIKGNGNIGLELRGTISGNIVDNKIISNAYAGIHISGGTNNALHGNTIAYNKVVGAWISSAGTPPNTFYLNNFINNTNQVRDFGLSQWDNTVIGRGNFWSDYRDRYPNAVEVDSLGIWNTSYALWGIIDQYPLTKPYQGMAPPVAEAGPSQRVFQGMTVTFDGSNSTDAIGIKSYVWNFTDVTPKTLTGVHPPYRFKNVGNFTVMLNVTNYADLWNTDTMWVNVSADTTKPSIGTVSQVPTVPIDGVNVTITVNVTDAESGVCNVTISYKANSGLWTNVSMSKTGNTWEGKIPGLPYGTNVTYKIIAYDNAGNFAVDDNAGRYYVYTVVPEFPAVIVLPLFIIATLVAVFLGKRERTPKS
jgi:parallel beta-helix repeat protein